MSRKSTLLNFAHKKMIRHLFFLGQPGTPVDMVSDKDNLWHSCPVETVGGTCTEYNMIPGQVGTLAFRFLSANGKPLFFSLVGSNAYVRIPLSK